MVDVSDGCSLDEVLSGGLSDELLPGLGSDVLPGGGSEEEPGADVVEIPSDVWLGSALLLSGDRLLEVGSGVAVATHWQIVEPAARALLMSLAAHPPSTHGRALLMMADEEAGVQRQATSSDFVHPISEPADRMQVKAQEGKLLVRGIQADWASTSPRPMARLTKANCCLMVNESGCCVSNFQRLVVE
jgi:hypothetical protein